MKSLPLPVRPAAPGCIQQGSAQAVLRAGSAPPFTVLPGSAGNWAPVDHRPVRRIGILSMGMGSASVQRAKRGAPPLYMLSRVPVAAPRFTIPPRTVSQQARHPPVFSVRCRGNLSFTSRYPRGYRHPRFTVPLRRCRRQAWPGMGRLFTVPHQAESAFCRRLRHPPARSARLRGRYSFTGHTNIRAGRSNVTESVSKLIHPGSNPPRS
ncbi:MAG: hypothetical protein QOJ99_4997 [Bryobacterales bacterium]|nr:hypothetical protein [Bryobacterales bacterium]